MAIKANFTGFKIAPPSWSNSKKCKHCGGNGWTIGGPIPKEGGSIYAKDGWTFYMSEGCYDCKYSETVGEAERNAHLRRIGRLDLVVT